MDWKKFWAPMLQERTKEQKWSFMWPNIISALGIFPGCLLAREYLNVWYLPGLLISKRVFKCLVGLWTLCILVFYCLFRMARIFIQ